jgi:hypothetical protein
VNPQQYYFEAYTVLALFVSAINSKALGASIVFMLGLLMVYPDVDKASFFTGLYITAVVAANFIRD